MKIQFDPRDLWIGVYWKRTSRVTTLNSDSDCYTVYLCLVPCFPIIFSLRRKIPAARRLTQWL